MRSTTPIILALLLAVAPAIAQVGTPQALPRRAELDVRELVEFADATSTELFGLGLVSGLSGTGDPLEDSATREALMALMRSQGMAVANPQELADARSVAMVWVRARIPNTGGRVGDTFTATITAFNGATSLEGGELMIAPLRHATPGGELAGFARGTLIVDDETALQRARIRQGVELVTNITPVQIGSEFELKVKIQYAGYSATSLVASTINDAYYNSDALDLPPVAKPIDDRIVRITVPEADRGALPQFLDFIMTRRVRDPDLLKLPARVIVNREAGAIVATANVDISPVGVAHHALQLTVTQPAPVATAQAPITSEERWTGLSSTPEGTQTAKLSDLLAAFRALEMPVAEQIEILEMMDRSGALHAEFIEE
ncbi:MAG: flagellar basal body P-ring protein FlgI [Phycisphaerales bacterium]